MVHFLKSFTYVLIPSHKVTDQIFASSKLVAAISEVIYFDSCILLLKGDVGKRTTNGNPARLYLD